MVRKQLFPVFVLLSLVWHSCSSTHVVYDDPYAIWEFNRTIADRSVKIEKNDGSVFEADWVWADSVVLSYRTEQHMNVVRLPLPEVKQLGYTDRGTGAIMGSLIGITGGILIAQATEPSEKSRYFDSSGLAQLGGAFLGFLLGVTGGAAVGHTNYYRFSSEPPPEDWRAEIDAAGDEPDAEPVLIRVEVSSLERTATGMILVRWQDRTIRLNETDIQKIERQGEKVSIWIGDDLYESEFARE